MSANILFEEKQVRRAWSKAEEIWYFAVADVIAVLTGSPNPQVYWRVTKEPLPDVSNQNVTNCNALKITAAGGKQRLTDLVVMEQLRRFWRARSRVQTSFNQAVCAMVAVWPDKAGLRQAVNRFSCSGEKQNGTTADVPPHWRS